MRKITATIAVGIAATGLTIGATTGAVADRLIGTMDVRNNTLRSVDVKDGTLGLRDLNRVTKAAINRPGPAGEDGTDGRDGVDGKDGAPGATGPAGAQGPAGPAGAPGAKGDKGDTGPQGEPGTDGTDGTDGVDGVSGYTLEGPEARWSNGAGETVAACPAGKVAIGGGYVVEGIRGGSATVTASAPVYVSQTEASGWRVAGTATGEANVKAWAVCATIAD